MFVHGRGYGQVRDRAEVGKVVYAMMRRAILSHQSGAVQTKDNGQPQEGMSCITLSYARCMKDE